MSELDDTVHAFLTAGPLAVAGVSRQDAGQPANLIYRKLRDSGRRVYAVNPRAEEVEGDRCYPKLESVPDHLAGVIIATPAGAAPDLVRACAALGIPRVWMHRAFGPGSVSEEAVELCRRHGIEVIPGGCPMMHCRPVDLGHRCIRWLLGAVGKLPRPVAAASAGSPPSPPATPSRLD